MTWLRVLATLLVGLVVFAFRVVWIGLQWVWQVVTRKRLRRGEEEA